MSTVVPCAGTSTSADECSFRPATTTSACPAESGANLICATSPTWYLSLSDATVMRSGRSAAPEPSQPEPKPMLVDAPVAGSLTVSLYRPHRRIAPTSEAVPSSMSMLPALIMRERVLDSYVQFPSLWYQEYSGVSR